MTSEQSAESKAQSVPNAMPHAPCAMPSAAEPLTIIGWLWRNPRCRTQYTIEHANIWARMIDRNLTLPHRIMLFTDTPEARFDPLIEPRPLWQDYCDLVAPGASAKKPQGYVKLKAFSAEFGELLAKLPVQSSKFKVQGGEGTLNLEPGTLNGSAANRFVSIDLDCVVTGPLGEILSRPDDFVIWRRAPLKARSLQVGEFQSSIWMLRAGARRQVWDDFHGWESLWDINFVPRAKEFLLGDQGWIYYKLGDNGEAMWDEQDGIYDFRWLIQEERALTVPTGCRIVFFPGPKKPWDLISVPWIRENWQ